MKKYSAKIIVNIKPSIKDIKGLTLKNAIENIVEINNLNCRVGSIYTINFDSMNIQQAEKIANKIAQEILSNEVIETYEVKIEEIYE